MSSRRKRPRDEQPQSRAEQKERTRRAILDAALRLTADAPLAAISLRQITHEVGIAPATFYRHFNSVDDLGLALVEESFASLRGVLRDVRRGRPEPHEIITTSIRALVLHADERRDHFGFIARERFAGPRVVRESVRQQLELFEHELAIDLARLTPTTWSTDDLHAAAKLIVAAMVATMADFVLGDPRSAHEVQARAEKQLRMLVVGTINWRSEDESE